MVTDKKTLYKYGITMCAAFLLITLFLRFKQGGINYWTAIASLSFLILAVLMPLALKPVYIFWMRLASALAWINTRLILLLIFYLVFTPIGLIMRLFRVDLLERKIIQGRDSYWKRKESPPFNPDNYTHQF